MTDSIHAKLLAVQAAIKAPKGQTNAFGKYRYRSCEDILEALKPLLKEHGLVLTLSDSIENIGTRFYVKATAKLWDGTMNYGPNPSEALLSVEAYAREEEEKKGMDGSQITGAASSYARKYALNGLFCIDDTKDSDATNTHDDKPAKAAPQKPAEPPKKAKPTVTQVMETLSGCADLTALDECYRRAKLIDFTVPEFADIQQCYENNRAKFVPPDAATPIA